MCEWKVVPVAEVGKTVERAYVLFLKIMTPSAVTGQDCEGKEGEQLQSKAPGHFSTQR